MAAQIFHVQAIVFANGQAHYALLEDTAVEDMDALWRVHVQNPMRLTALLSAKLRKHNVSYVLFIGSIWGEAGSAGETLYATVKGSLDMPLLSPLPRKRHYLVFGSMQLLQALLIQL